MSTKPMFSWGLVTGSKRSCMLDSEHLPAPKCMRANDDEGIEGCSVAAA